MSEEKVSKRDLRTGLVQAFGNYGLQPRAHQIRTVGKIVCDVASYEFKNEHEIRNYLIQHTAGSGKSLTIAALVLCLQKLKARPRLSPRFLSIYFQIPFQILNFILFPFNLWSSPFLCSFVTDPAKFSLSFAFDFVVLPSLRGIYKTKCNQFILFPFSCSPLLNLSQFRMAEIDVALISSSC